MHGLITTLGISGTMKLANSEQLVPNNPTPLPTPFMFKLGTCQTERRAVWHSSSLLYVCSINSTPTSTQPYGLAVAHTPKALLGFTLRSQIIPDQSIHLAPTIPTTVPCRPELCDGG